MKFRVKDMNIATVMYMDWIFLSQLEQFREEASSGRTIHLQKILPIYKNGIIRITEERKAQYSTVKFFRKNQQRVNALVLAKDQHLP